ncbi:MAG: YbaB/EbfC family nucleoid-associated protein [Lewinellaceae bacterium]|nr:YbaB/EbfC family nucleoid-associated protein [Lewinellaceae bacterium]
MLDDLMGNFDEQQKQMQDKLMSIVVEHDENGVKIVGNAARQITDFEISDDLFNGGDKEMLQDLILVSINSFIEKQIEAEAEESKKMMESMLPPGFGQLFK